MFPAQGNGGEQRVRPPKHPQQALQSCIPGLKHTRSLSRALSEFHSASLQGAGLWRGSGGDEHRPDWREAGAGGGCAVKPEAQELISISNYNCSAQPHPGPAGRASCGAVQEAWAISLKSLKDAQERALKPRSISS